MLTEIQIITTIKGINNLALVARIPEYSKQLEAIKDTFLGDLEEMAKTPKGKYILNNLSPWYKKELMVIFPLFNNTDKSEVK